MSEQTIKDFITYFKSLSESEQFKLGGHFKKETGGSLSPFDSPKPVSVALIPIIENNVIKLLGVIRGIPPGIGENAFPGGYVNEKENPLEAVAREVFEETGLKTSSDDYSFLSSQTTERNVLLTFYKNKNIYHPEILESLVLNPEVQGFVLLDRESIMAFPAHKEAALSYFNFLENGNPKSNKIKFG